MRFAHIQRPTAFFLGICAFAWALGFAKYFGHWVFFPAFPNVFDSLGMSLTGVYLLYLAVSRGRNPISPFNPASRPALSVLDDIDDSEESRKA